MYYNRVVDHHTTMAEQEAARETRRKQRDERSGLLSVWKEEEQAQRERNESRRKAYQEELQLWKDERDQAMMEKRRPHWGKPKRGKLEPPVAKPVGISGVAEEEGENVVDKEDNNNNNQSDDGCKSAIAMEFDKH